MHNKFCIIDDETVITGSFNWTKNADNSLENALMISGDYPLVKEYLHEFEDLKHYSESNHLARSILYAHGDGSRCGSLAYNVGVFGYPDGNCGAQQVAIWKICAVHRRVLLLKSIIIHNSFEDNEDVAISSSDDWRESREGMVDQFHLERRIMYAPSKFLKRDLGLEVHAYGCVQPAPQGYKVDAYLDSQYCLELTWRHMYWRKIIPSRLLYDEGDVRQIILRHRPGNFNGRL